MKLNVVMVLRCANEHQNDWDNEVSRETALLLIFVVPSFLHGMDYVKLI